MSNQHLIESLEYRIYKLYEEEQKKKSSKVGTALKGAAAGLVGGKVGAKIGGTASLLGKKGRKELSDLRDYVSGYTNTLNGRRNAKKMEKGIEQVLMGKGGKRNLGQKLKDTVDGMKQMHQTQKAIYKDTSKAAKKLAPSIIRNGKIGAGLGAAAGIGAYAAHKYNQHKKAQ